MIAFASDDLWTPATVRRYRPPSARGEKVLKPIRASAAIEAAYAKKLAALVDEMARSVLYWTKSAYRANPPEIAQDELASSALKEAIRRLTARWLRRFDAGAEELARWFAQSTNERSDAALMKILRDAGFAIEFKLTAAQRDVLNAVVQENVALIKSIPRRYFAEVEGAVMRSVQTGRDLKQLTGDLQRIGGVTRRRARFIALDQNNKAMANLTRARHLEIGLTEAVWVHSGAGKEPRPSHVKAGRDKARFDIREGWYDPHERRHILPGELPRCRCVMRPVVKGFS